MFLSSNGSVASVGGVMSVLITAGRVVVTMFVLITAGSVGVMLFVLITAGGPVLYHDVMQMS